MESTHWEKTIKILLEEINRLEVERAKREDYIHDLQAENVRLNQVIDNRYKEEKCKKC